MSESPSIPDRGHLLTEQRLAASAQLDALAAADVLRIINEEDAAIAAVVRQAIPRIAQLVENIVAGMQRGGRLIYLGAGTSGRLGVLDASEIPPTFQCDADRVIGLIAGGDAALRKSSEGREDDPDGARGELDKLQLTDADTVIGIAAGGTTPYVLGGLAIAAERGAATAMICCVPETQVGGEATEARRHGGTPGQGIKDSGLRTRHLICLPVGPEVVTGSTRMKAGTATKLALNMISTAVMVRLGKVWGNLMIDLKASNEKLRDRAIRLILSQTSLSRDAAGRLLDDAGASVKVALVMASRDLDAEAARRLLAEHGQQLRPILGSPRG